ncbi:MAG: hypothetical protein EAX96_18365 [Candidatus Lokiarchaeota archaeon]|nr:hypothetical protein [Candidatus Lokiarchaeota archaeon]
MEGLNKKNIKKIGIIVGIVFIITGLIFNTILPSKFSRVHNSESLTLNEEDNYYVISIDPNINHIDYEFKIDFYTSISEESNCTVLILNSMEYQKFLVEDSLENITALKIINSIDEPRVDSLFYRGIFSSRNIGAIYILIINLENTSEIINYGYYYTISTPMFFYSAILLVIGAITIFSMLAWYLNGWKRYFSIGVGINLSLFFARITIMPYLFSELPTLISFFEIFDIEVFRDFEGYYIGWTDLFINGVFPYSEQYFGYAYGPLFILTTGSFAFLSIPSWSVGIPFLMSTLGTGYLIYLISRKLTNNEKYSICSMMLFFINPFTLIYASFIWLNASIFTFFVILSFYLALVKKNYLAMLTLGIASMYKQFALVFFPLLLLLMIMNNKGENRKIKLKNSIIYSLIFGITILLISLPFLILRFQSYIWGNIINISFSINSLITPGIYDNYPVTFNSFFFLIGAPDIILYSIAYMLGYYILLGGTLGITYLFYARNLQYKTKYKNSINTHTNLSYFVEALFLSIFIVISLQLFYPRGSFKYYLILLTPFISLLFDIEDLSLHKAILIEKSDFRFYKRYLIPIFISWVVFFCYRYVYFFVLIGWCLYYLYYYNDKFKIRYVESKKSNLLIKAPKKK